MTRRQWCWLVEERHVSINMEIYQIKEIECAIDWPFVDYIHLYCGPITT